MIRGRPLHLLAHHFHVIEPDNDSRNLRDLAFPSTTLYYRNDSLRYEKALLDKWLEREFPDPDATPNPRSPL